MGPQRLGSSACLSCDPELTCWRQAEQGGDLGESGTGAGAGGAGGSTSRSRSFIPRRLPGRVMAGVAAPRRRG